MTNEPEGRTYISYSWELKNPNMWLSRFPEDYVQVETPHIVPNGKWVMEYLLIGSGWRWLVGIPEGELEHFVFTDKNGVQRVLFTHDKPFGYIVVDEDEDVDQSVYPPVPSGRRRLECARQIHKGELGKSVPIPRLNCARANDKKRGSGWIRLTELASAADLSVEDVVFGYWQFSRTFYRHFGNGEVGGPLLDVVVAYSPDDIKSPVVFSYTQADMAEILRMCKRVGGSYIENLWVRRGFAYTILRLRLLGVQPSIAQPA